MKASYVEGIATQTGPKSCVAAREHPRLPGCHHLAVRLDQPRARTVHPALGHQARFHLQRISTHHMCLRHLNMSKAFVGQNHIKAMRLGLGMSQRDLAKAAGTSQQQIQRIESGAQEARLDLVSRIADALKCDLAKLFPKPKLPKRNPKSAEDGDDSVAAARAWRDVGLDPDPRSWSLAYRLRNGVEGLIQISGNTYSILHRTLQTNDLVHPFVVFDSLTHRCALNRDELAWWQFRFDPPEVASGDDAEDKEDGDQVELTVHLCGCREAILLWCWSDPVVYDPDPQGDDRNDEAELQNFFCFLELHCRGDKDGLGVLTDIDGEQAFFRLDAIAFASVPLAGVELALQNALREDVEDGEGTTATSTATTTSA